VPARRAIRGRILKVHAPEWEPLLNLAPDHVVDFMWMGSVLLADGTRIQVYKHYWTRDYLHLADDGRAFVFVPKTRYEEVNPPWLLMRVLRKELDPEGISTLERRYVGRPSLGRNGLSPRVSFRVPPELHKAAWARADKEGKSLSELAREAFNRYMDS